MISDVAHHVMAYFISEAAASPNMGEGTDVVRLAPGFSWNFSFGQIMQVGGVIITMIVLWSKGQVRHAMLMRDLSEMRVDVNRQERALVTVTAQVTQIDLYLRQLPALIAATERGRRPFTPFSMQMQNGNAEASFDPFKEALREQLGGGDETREIADKVIEAFKKLAGVKE